MKADGSLEWKHPAGTWMILRIGYSLTGAMNRPASPEATAELDRQLNLSEAVLRTKVLRADELIAQRAEQSKRDAAKTARASKASA